MSWLKPPRPGGPSPTGFGRTPSAAERGAPAAERRPAAPGPEASLGKPLPGPKAAPPAMAPAPCTPAPVPPPTPPRGDLGPATRPLAAAAARAAPEPTPPPTPNPGPLAPSRSAVGPTVGSRWRASRRPSLRSGSASRWRRASRRSVWRSWSPSYVRRSNHWRSCGTKRGWIHQATKRNLPVSFDRRPFRESTSVWYFGFGMMKNQPQVVWIIVASLAATLCLAYNEVPLMRPITMLLTGLFA
mmetsp:Transcript_5502/g.13742  ORF Transcript_5502/g.13742 Transcript_5502/m.13742 type:complete len:243 (-) Transcript_5502:1929-2657(-)